MDLSADLDKVISQKDFISELNKDLKEARQAHPLFGEIEEMRKEMKKKKDQMEADEAIDEIKDQLSTARERMQLLKEILTAKMEEQELEEVTAKDKKAVMIKSMKIEKNRGV